MALTIEDGTVVSGADSYITVAEYNTWADARFGSGRSTAPATDAAAEQLILRAMDYFETLNFQGEIYDDDQPLQWPRTSVVIDRIPINYNEIPKEVKNALYELSYAEEKSLGMLNVWERKTIMEKVGPVEKRFSEGSATRKIPVAVHKWVKKLLVSSGTFVMRA